MKRHYLMLKIHKQTGLKYLCKCSTNNVNYCYQYKGSGKYWKRHLRKHGNDIITIILAICQNNEELAKIGEKYSTQWNVVNNPDFANLIPETGQGGFSKQARQASLSKKSIAKRAHKFRLLFKGQTKENCERVARMAATKKGRTKNTAPYLKEAAKKVSKGIYHTPFGDFISPEDAAKAINTTACSSIRKACTTNKDKVISQYAATVVKWWKLIEGKTYGEMGFGFTAK